MSNHNYPREMPGTWWKHHNRPGVEKCAGCGKRFAREDSVLIIETQVSWMRGDDEVEGFCEACAAKKGHVNPKSDVRRLIQSLTAKIQNADREVAKLLDTRNRMIDELRELSPEAVEKLPDSRAIVELLSGAKCQYEECDRAATDIACGRLGEDRPSHPKPAAYCRDHANMVSDEGCPEYTGTCPNCGCTFPIN